MDEQFDKQLKDRIKEMFDDYEDTFADEGWLLLRKKFPGEQKRRRLAWIWWGAAAAILLIFLGVGIWLFNDSKQPEKFSLKPKKVSPSQTIAATPNNDSANKTRQANTSVPPNPAGIKAASQVATTVNQVKNQPTINNKITSAKKTGLFAADSNAQKRLIAKKPVVQHKNITTTPAKQLAANGDESAATGPVTGNTSPVASNALAANTNPGAVNANPAAPAVKPNTVTQAVVTPAPTQPRTLANVIAEEQKAMNQKATEEIKRDKKVHYGVYATTFFNYAKGSSNQVNAGAGFTAEISLTTHLKLVTGMAIAQNSLSYDSGPPQVYTASPALVPASFSAAAYSVNYVVSAPSFKDYNASLIGLDVPVNLKYVFNPQKSDTYFSAGVSSGMFINESYTYQYNYPALASASLQQPQDQTSSKNFNDVYLAKTLNVAFGVGYPIGRNHLVIEPFLKYPLQGLGAQDIRFGAGGINLKFNFKAGK
jgi:hypothetical protein